MAQGNINLHIGSTFSPEGFKRLDSKIKSTGKLIGKFGHSFGSVMSAAENVAHEIENASSSAREFGGTLGKVAGAAAPLLQGFLSMGVWGIVIGVIGTAVGLMKSFMKTMDGARLAARGLSREYMTIEYQAKRYQARLDAVKAAHAEMLAAMKEAASLSNAKDAEDLAAYERQFEYSMAIAENEAKTVAEVAKQAKLKREIATIDAKSKRMKANAVVKVGVDVESPDPVEVDVKKPKPTKVETIAPDPVKVSAIAPQPVAVDTIAPDPVAVETIAPDPIKVDAHADPVRVTAIKPDPVAVKTIAPDPVAVTAIAPKPVEVAVKEPKPTVVKVDDPAPVEIKTAVQPVDIPVNEPTASVKVNQPDPVVVKAIEPPPVSVRVNKPKPVKVDTETPKPIDIETRIINAQQASSNFEQEAAWHIEAVTKMANADIAMAKAEADKAIAFERVEVAARTRALKTATDQYGSGSRVAIAAQRALIAAQEKMAKTIEKSSRAVEKSQAAAERQIVKANMDAARRRAQNAAAMIAEARAEGKVAIKAAREAGAEQIRAAEAAVKIAKGRAIGVETLNQKRLDTHDVKTAREKAVAQYQVDEKKKALVGARSRSKNRYGEETRTPEVLKAETELAAAERNLAGISDRAAIERGKIAHEGEIALGKAEMALTQATNALATARDDAQKAERAVVLQNAQTLTQVKRQAQVLKELADYRAQEILTARRAAQQNEKSIRENAALDERIEAAKTAAAKWQEEMARVRARDGEGRQIDFNEFKRREKKRDKEIAVDERRGKKIDDQAKGERDRLQNRIFDRNGRLRKSANKQDIARWQELNRFIEMRKGNNPAQNAADALERRKARNIADIKTNVANIEKALGKLGL